MSSLRTPVDHETQNELSEADPNDKTLDSDSSDDNFDLGSRVRQAGQWKEKSRSKSMIHASCGDSLDCHTSAFKPSLIFVLWILGSQGVHNEQVFTISANAAEKLETRIDTLEIASLGATLSGKKVLAYTAVGMVIESSLIAIYGESLSITTKVETTKGSSKRVDKGLP